MEIGKCKVIMHSHDRIVVSTLRCGRNNPGSNPGHVIFIFEKGFPMCFDEHRPFKVKLVNAKLECIAMIV